MDTQAQYQLVRSDGANWAVGEGEKLSLGRSRQNVVQIADSAVSRVHATLLVARSRCWIRDESSAHGTYVNGQRVMGQQELRLGDQLRIGSAVFHLERVAVAVEARGAPLPQRQRQLVTWGVVSAVVIVAVIVIALSAGGGEGTVGDRDRIVFIDSAGNELESSQFETETASIGDLKILIVSDKTGQRLPSILVLNNSQTPERVLVGAQESHQLYRLDSPPVKVDLDAYDLLGRNLRADQLYDYLQEHHSENTCILFGQSPYSFGESFDLYDVGESNTLLAIESSGESTGLSRGPGLLKVIQRDPNEDSYNFVVFVYKVLNIKEWFIESFIYAYMGMKIEIEQDRLDELDPCEPNDPYWGCVKVKVRNQAGDAIEGAEVTMYMEIESSPYDKPYKRLTDSQGIVAFPVIPRHSTLLPEYSYYLKMGSQGYRDWDGESCPFEGCSDRVVQFEVILSQGDGVAVSCLEQADVEDNEAEEGEQYLEVAISPPRGRQGEVFQASVSGLEPNSIAIAGLIRPGSTAEEILYGDLSADAKGETTFSIASLSDMEPGIYTVYVVSVEGHRRGEATFELYGEPTEEPTEEPHEETTTLLPAPSFSAPLEEETIAWGDWGCETKPEDLRFFWEEVRPDKLWEDSTVQYILWCFVAHEGQWVGGGVLCEERYHNFCYVPVDEIRRLMSLHPADDTYTWRFKCGVVLVRKSGGKLKHISEKDFVKFYIADRPCLQKPG